MLYISLRPQEAQKPAVPVVKPREPLQESRFSKKYCNKVQKEVRAHRLLHFHTISPPKHQSLGKREKSVCALIKKPQKQVQCSPRRGSACSNFSPLCQRGLALPKKFRNTFGLLPDLAPCSQTGPDKFWLKLQEGPKLTAAYQALLEVP